MIISEATETIVCKHFGVCGGCQCVPSPDGPPAPAAYASQLQHKEERVRNFLGPYDVEEWRPILPSPETWHYRNKMEYAFGPELVLGLRESGRFDRVVDL